jgi:hypothetical protein
MNWKLVVAVAAFGVVMGLASVLGWTDGLEGWLWLAILSSASVASLAGNRRSSGCTASLSGSLAAVWHR